MGRARADRARSLANGRRKPRGGDICHRQSVPSPSPFLPLRHLANQTAAAGDTAEFNRGRVAAGSRVFLARFGGDSGGATRRLGFITAVRFSTTISVGVTRTDLVFRRKRRSLLHALTGGRTPRVTTETTNQPRSGKHVRFDVAVTYERRLIIIRQYARPQIYRKQLVIVLLSFITVIISRIIRSIAINIYIY